MSCELNKEMLDAGHKRQDLCSKLEKKQADNTTACTMTIGFVTYSNAYRVKMRWNAWEVTFQWYRIHMYIHNRKYKPIEGYNCTCSYV